MAGEKTQPASQSGFNQKKTKVTVLGRETERNADRSAGPGKTGLRGMAKGSSLQEVSKKDVTWDKAGSCEYCLALPSCKALPPLCYCLASIPFPGLLNLKPFFDN